MKVAFCTNNKTHVDEHFGRSESIAIYDVSPDGHSFDEMRPMTAVDSSREDHSLDTEAKAEKLSDCAMIYMEQIGGPAAAVVVRKGIHPVKVEPGTAIDNILNNIVEVLGDNPPPWLKKAMMKG
ncbi:nitrogen fixation protein NifX [Limisalsivibrio acetivorans]|uniref:nitrogen fixation protein NifX n=1 Tax=Limisalsivibrio acetivorans TaxID=1304888 RepID=UPI0003B4FF61|nr:nitrogen fixation protein NifX [Limisalsivibrio acetivorans]